MAISDVFGVVDPNVYLQHSRMLQEGVISAAERQQRERMQNQQVELQMRDQDIKKNESIAEREQRQAELMAAQNAERAREQGVQADRDRKFNFDLMKYGDERSDKEFDQQLRLGEFGQKQEMHELDKQKKIREEMEIYEMREAAKEGLPGIRNFLIAKGDGKGALELDAAEADIQSKILGGQKTLMEIKDLKQQAIAGQAARLITMTMAGISESNDPIYRKEQIAKLAEEVDAIADTNISSKDPAVQSTILASAGINFAKQAKIMSENPSRENLEFFLNFYTKVPQENRSKGMSVTTPDGTVVEIGGAPGDLQKPTLNKLQEDYYRSQKALTRFAEIDKNVDLDQLTALGAGTLAVDKFLDKIGLASKESKANIQKAEKFIPKMERALAQYLKDISGSAVTETEFKRTREMYINGDITQTQYGVRLGELINEEKANIRTIEETYKKFQNNGTIQNTQGARPKLADVQNKAMAIQDPNKREAALREIDNLISQGLLD